MKISKLKIIASSFFLNLPLVAASFHGLGDLTGGNFFSVATSVSADGTVVCGYSSSTASGTTYEAFRWTATNGMIALGDLPGGIFSSFANAVSADGTTVVGQSRFSPTDEAFRWTQATGMVGLGDLTGGVFSSSAQGVSRDGMVIAGNGFSANGREAFRWTTDSGMIGLGDLSGGSFDSRAWGISADGAIVCGESSATNGSEAFRWTAAAGMVGLGDLPGGISNSIAYGISADGSTIVGYGLPPSNVHEAFRWTAQTGMVGLDFLPCDTWTIARAVSGDGSVIVGDPQISSCRCVFIWDAQHGMRELFDVLTNDFSLDLTGWQLCRATGIAWGGNIIVGYGVNPSGNTEAWMANITPPTLTVRRESNNIILSWPADAPGFTLQSATNLISPVSWIDSTNTPTIVGTEFTVTNAASESSLFYRLKK